MLTQYLITFMCPECGELHDVPIFSTSFDGALENFSAMWLSMNKIIGEQPLPSFLAVSVLNDLSVVGKSNDWLSE